MALGPNWRIGHGYDLHRLDARAPAGAGRPLVIGGVAFQHDRGPVSHSDGDALLHAITDALLGAAGLDDLGTLFPNSDPRWEGADSGQFLAEAARRVREAGWEIANVDATVLLEKPRLGSRRGEIRARIAGILGMDAGLVNVKGKSGEGLGPVGESLAIEAHALVLLCARDQ